MSLNLITRVILKKAALLASILLLCLPAPVARGTTILAIRAEDEMLIGVDSLFRLNDGPPVNICKIKQVGNFFFAFAGKFIITTPAFDIHVGDISDQVFGVPGPLSDKLQRYNQMIETNLTQVVEFIRQDRVRYDQYFGDGKKKILEVVIAGVQNGGLVVYKNEYEIASGPDEPTRILSKSIAQVKPLPGIESAIKAGFYSACNNLLSQNFYPDPVTRIKACIFSEILAHPDYVGDPIDIIRIRPQGSEWVQNHDCLPVQPLIVNSPVR
jgi:hypothetical protein